MALTSTQSDGLVDTEGKPLARGHVYLLNGTGLLCILSTDPKGKLMRSWITHGGEALSISHYVDAKDELKHVGDMFKIFEIIEMSIAKQLRAKGYNT